ncbi:F-box/LRR-repeat protein 4-like isoform X2 [Cimex lectularius]|uniref:Uncharacterized protein n=1 Tax=Cimex lectularius TaxID=79782 RepID=A0A8I6RLE2_CIMLE|nr:F-box/LRR-repeat protein 4-like isoform X2 [Cimex lectularius]
MAPRPPFCVVEVKLVMWNELSRNPRLIKKLEFGPSLHTDTVISVLRRCYSLRDLKFFCRRDINDLLTEVALSNLKLTRLKINSSRDNRLTDINTGILLNVLRSCTQLGELTVKRCSFEDPDEFYKNVGPLLPHAKIINFNHNLQLGSEQLTELINYLRPVEDLRIYCLSFNRIGSVTPYSDRPVLQLLSKMCGTLRVLKLNMLGLGDAVMASISECTLLRALHMYRVVNIHDESLLLITRLPHLETLVVTVPRAITSAGWRNVITHENMKNMKVLTISNSHAIDDSVLTSIARSCRNLEKISLPGCRKVSNIGLNSLMVSCNKLEYLNLFSTKSSVSETFPAIPDLLPNLKTLIYRPVDRQNQDFANLTHRMPNLKMTSVYRYI